MPVSAIDLTAVLSVLEPIWATKTESAKRVRGRIESILDWATIRGHRTGENPARWRGHLESLLAKPSRIARVEHHAAVPSDGFMPGFMTSLRRRQGVAAAALEFTVLTCARSGEVLGARWAEIDLGARVWTIPASQMKGGREHRILLSAPALGILDRMARFKSNSDDHVFLGRETGRPLTSPAMLQCLLLVRKEVTTHGFRSTFRNWAAERTDFRLKAPNSRWRTKSAPASSVPICDQTDSSGAAPCLTRGPLIAGEVPSPRVHIPGMPIIDLTEAERGALAAFLREATARPTASRCHRAGGRSRARWRRSIRSPSRHHCAFEAGRHAGLMPGKMHGLPPVKRSRACARDVQLFGWRRGRSYCRDAYCNRGFNTLPTAALARTEQ